MDAHAEGITVAMAQQRRVLGVPVHPLLVHFPIVFWLLSPFFDLGALLAGEPWAELAFGATPAGVVTGAAAVVTGLLDYMQPSLAGIDVHLAAKHGIHTALAWCIFTARSIAGAFFLHAAGWPAATWIALDIAGCAVLIRGVYYGTRQVYEQLEKS